MDTAARIAALRRVALFAGLPPPLLEEVAAIAATRALERGQTLFSEGDAAEFLPVLVAGRVKLFRANADGREQVLHMVRAPQTFGEAAVFGPGVFPASAEAVEASRLVTVPRAGLLALLRHRPELALALLASLSAWMRRLVDLIDGLSLHTVEERVAAYLWSALVRAGQPMVPGSTVRLDEAKHTIAALCGTAPEVLSRTFRRLEASGCVRVSGPSVTLLDPDGLAVLARIGEQAPAAPLE